MVNDRVATTLNFLYCHEDTAHRGARRACGMVGMFGLANAICCGRARRIPTRAYQTLGNLAPGAAQRERRPRRRRTASPEGICVGDPDSISEAVERWESIGVDRHQLHVQRGRVGPAAAGAREHAAVRREVMPRFRVALMLTGTAPVDELVAHAATMSGFDTDALTLPDAEVFQAMFEMPHRRTRDVAAAGIAPHRRADVHRAVLALPRQSVGPVLARAGAGRARAAVCDPRGHVQGCVCDNDEASAALRARWGFPVQSGTVTLRHHYDAVEALASVDGHVVLSIRGQDPEPLGNGDIAYSSTVALAHTPRGLRLVQIEYDVAVTRAERLRPHLDEFDAAGFGVHPTVEPYHPVSASIALGTIELHRLRFVCRPDELAFTGTEPIDA